MVARTKSKIVHEFFDVMTEYSPNDKVTEHLNKFARNKFTGDIRYVGGKLIVKDGKMVKSYDFTNLTDEEKADITISYILKIFKIKVEIDEVGGDGDDLESTSSGSSRLLRTVGKKVIDNMFSTMSPNKKTFLLSRFSQENSNGTLQHKKVILATINTGLLIKAIDPKKDIQMSDDKIIHINNISIDKEGKVCKLSLPTSKTNSK